MMQLKHGTKTQNQVPRNYANNSIYVAYGCFSLYTIISLKSVFYDWLLGKIKKG